MARTDEVRDAELTYTSQLRNIENFEKIENDARSRKLFYSVPFKAAFETEKQRLFTNLAATEAVMGGLTELPMLLRQSQVIEAIEMAKQFCPKANLAFKYQGIEFTDAKGRKAYLPIGWPTDASGEDVAKLYGSVAQFSSRTGVPYISRYEQAADKPIIISSTSNNFDLPQKGTHLEGSQFYLALDRYTGAPRALRVLTYKVTERNALSAWYNRDWYDYDQYFVECISPSVLQEKAHR